MRIGAKRRLSTRLRDVNLVSRQVRFVARDMNPQRIGRAELDLRRLCPAKTQQLNGAFEVGGNRRARWQVLDRCRCGTWRGGRWRYGLCAQGETRKKQQSASGGERREEAIHILKGSILGVNRARPENDGVPKQSREDVSSLLLLRLRRLLLLRLQLLVIEVSVIIAH